VLGGMGPAASAEFYARVVAATAGAWARRDQDHLHLIIDSDPSVPDRTEALLRGGDSPVPTLRRMARRLADAGADLLVMACNTASAFLPELTDPRLPDPVSVPFVKWHEVVAAELCRSDVKVGAPEEVMGGCGASAENGGPAGQRGAGSGRAGRVARPAAVLAPGGTLARGAPGRAVRGVVGPVAVLATDGTVASQLYGRHALARYGIEAFPADAVQSEVMAVIRARKAGEPVSELAPRLDRVIDALVRRGAATGLLACTELSELSGGLTAPHEDAMDLVVTHLLRRVAEWEQTPGRFLDDGLLTTPQ